VPQRCFTDWAMQRPVSGPASGLTFARGRPPAGQASRYGRRHERRLVTEVDASKRRVVQRPPIVAIRIRRKVFISYHHADQDAANAFVDHFDDVSDVFIRRGLGIGMAPDIVNSRNPEYVMTQIRRRYLQDTSVTIVLIGRCTWARRYVDWEIQASLRRPALGLPNGLLGIKLPSYRGGLYPDRLNRNLKAPGETREVYARVINYPQIGQQLVAWIEDAFRARTQRAGSIVNPRERQERNSPCL
jgi:hypothetical protein